MDSCLSSITSRPLVRMLNIWADMLFITDINSKIDSWPRARLYVADNDASIMNPLQKQVGYFVNCIDESPLKAARHIASEGIHMTPPLDLVYVGPSSVKSPSEVLIALTFLSASKIQKGSWIVLPSSLEASLYDLAYVSGWIHRGIESDMTYYECVK